MTPGKSTPSSEKQIKPLHKGAGHRKRLREKFLRSGLDGFLDYEVIELLLTFGTPRRDCKDAAKAALKKFKTLQGVFEASSEELCEIDDIGPTNPIGILLIKAVADRYLEKRLLKKNPLNNSKDLYDFLYLSIGEKQRECFQVVFLNAKNKVISTETLFQGTLTASAVYPREVVNAALRNNASAIIFAHNHPSGDPEPSQEDIAITRQLIFACRVMGITVHEHLIIGEKKYFSFADKGYIAQMNREFERQ